MPPLVPYVPSQETRFLDKMLSICMGGTSQVSIPQVLMVGDLYLSADVWYATPLLVLVCPEEKVDVGKKLNTNVSLVGTYFFALLLALRHIILGGQKVGITFCSLIFSEPCTRSHSNFEKMFIISENLLFSQFRINLVYARSACPLLLNR